MIWRCCSRPWMIWVNCCKRFWSLAYKQEWFVGILLLTTLHVNTFKLTRVLRTSSQFCCHDSLHEARSGAKGWGWQAKDGGSKKSGLDSGHHAPETLHDEIYEAWWIKCNLILRLSVRAPRHARDGVSGIVEFQKKQFNRYAVPCIVKKWIG